MVAAALVVSFIWTASAFRRTSPWSPPLRRAASLRAGDGEGERPAEDGRPPVIPFDFSEFVREDKAAKPRSEEKPRDPAPALPPLEQSSSGDTRPTGYGSADNEDDDLFPEPQSSSLPLRLLRDLYLPSPYDSSSRRQAKLVARNITAFSLAIGVIFTALWYLSPVKFVSFGGERPATSQPAALPEDFRESALNSSPQPSDLLDDSVGKPNESFLRVPYKERTRSERDSTFPAQDI